MEEYSRKHHIVMLMVLACLAQTESLACPYDTPGGKVTSIASNSLPPGLGKVTFRNLPLTSIADDAFSNSTTTLRELYIGGTQLRQLPRALLALTQLTLLSITDTPMQDWDTAVLQRIGSSVTYLELRNVGLTAWPNWCSNFNVLQTLWLGDNALHSIPNDAFVSFNATLRDLHLGNTSLTHIPLGLASITDLASLNVSNNKFVDLEELERTPLSFSIQNLTYLYLDSVGMTDLGDYTNMTFLRFLSVANNQISNLSAGSFPPFVKILNLKRNNISSIPTDMANLDALSYLELSNNHITEIEPDSFPSSLEELYMGFNKLAKIQSSTFRGLRVLRTLVLSNNPISEISNIAFMDLVSLTYLRLTNSNLTAVPLAFASIKTDLDVEVSSNQALSCPCPAPLELVEWYTSYRILSLPHANCSNGQSMERYLGGLCASTINHGVSAITKTYYSSPVHSMSSPPPPPSTTFSSSSSSHPPSVFLYYCLCMIIFVSYSITKMTKPT